MGRWPRWWIWDLERPPQAQLCAASSASPGAHHHPWSSPPGGAAGVPGACSLSPGAGGGCPASAEHGRCGQDCATGMRTLRLGKESRNTKVKDMHCLQEQKRKGAAVSIVQ